MEVPLIKDIVWLNPNGKTIMIAPENKYSYFFKWLKKNGYVKLGDL